MAGTIGSRPLVATIHRSGVLRGDDGHRRVLRDELVADLRRAVTVSR